MGAMGDGSWVEETLRGRRAYRSLVMRGALVLLCGLVLAGPAVLQGATCSCDYPPVCQAVQQRKLIFLGRAVELVAPTTERPEGTLSVEVLERFVGHFQPGAEVEIAIRSYSSPCGERETFELGQTYVFSPVLDRRGDLSEGGCSASALAADVPDRLQFLRDYAAGRTPTSIRGRVRWGFSDIPVRDGKITATGPGESVLVSRTDSNGQFDLTVPGLGVYRLRVNAPGYRSAKPDYIVGVIGGACSEVGISGVPDRVVSGRAVLPDGSPAANVRVWVWGESTRWASSEQTSETGEFVIAGMEPGVYRLAVNPQGTEIDTPYSTQFSDRPVAVPDAETFSLDDLVFPLAERAPTRKIRLKVWLLGRPAEARVAWRLLGPDVHRHYNNHTTFTDGNGRAGCEISGRHRVAIEILAHDGGESYQREVTLPPGEDESLVIDLGPEDRVR